MSAFAGTIRRRLSWAALVFLAGLTLAQGQDARIADQRAAEHPLSIVGLAVGERIPEFHAPDQDGTIHDFASIRGPGGAVLFFHRSAGWCIYCRGQLEETEASLEGLRKNGMGLAAISYDAPEVLKHFAEEKKIHFPLLSDPSSKIIRDFKVLDATVPPGEEGYGVPYHGSYVVDAAGVVIAKFFDTAPPLPHSTGVVVSRVFGSPLNTHARVLTQKHLVLSYYANVNAAAPGDDFDLFIDITLNDNIHVGKPGRHGSTSFEWHMDRQPGVTVRPVAYSPVDDAEVYTGKVTLMRRVRLELGDIPVDAQGNVSLKGSLTFQPGNGTTQFAETTIPLEWRLGQTPRR